MEALYRAVFTSVADAILVADAESRYLDANAAATTLLGYTRDELLQLRVADIVANDNAWTEEEYVRFVHAGAWQGELELRRKDGTLVPVEARATSLTSITGAVYVSVLRDITERKRWDAERAQILAHEQDARAAAQEAVRVRDQFFSIAAHELKTPLTSILGNAQLLQRRLARTDTVTPREMRTLNVLIEQARRLNTMITTLFDVSRMELGQFNIECTPLNLAALVQRVVTTVQPAHTTHTITYMGLDTPLTINGDVLRLEQVVQNLIQNAIKYSPAGGPVAVSVEARAGQACICVRDQGIGIPQAALPQLFGRFYRAPNAAKQQASGLGIGLYIVKEIVTLHGGTVDVMSQEGQGSTFTICLPLTNAPHEGRGAGR
jgi:PAS domain S-box-containing protein